jgi:hypothetical protein
LSDDDEVFTEEEARWHFQNRITLDGSDPNAVTWDDPPAPAPMATRKSGPNDDTVYAELRRLAAEVVRLQAVTAYDHLTKAALALGDGDVDTLSTEVDLAKASLPKDLVSGIVASLFSSLGQMIATTITQFRTVTGPLRSTGSLMSSLGLGTELNLGGWPTL